MRPRGVHHRAASGARELGMSAAMKRMQMLRTSLAFAAAAAAIAITACGDNLHHEEPPGQGPPDARPPAPPDAPPVTPPVPAGSTLTFGILETTDIHTNILGYDYFKLTPDPTIGIERTATLVTQARAE